MFRTAHYLLRDVGAEAVMSPRAEAVGEQGEHYDPLSAYNEGDEAGYFAVPEESGGDAADVGPSGAGKSCSVKLFWVVHGRFGKRKRAGHSC